MKILHTSDWHLGQTFYRHERDDEHRHFLSQLTELMRLHRPDALVVSGDVFHNAAPSAAAQELFNHALLTLHDASPDTRIVVTAGNHDSGTRLHVQRELWQRVGAINVVGSYRRLPDGAFDASQFIIDLPDKGHIVAVPYFHISNYPQVAPDGDRTDRRREFFSAVTAAVADSPLPVVMMAHMAVDGCDIRGHEETMVGGMLTENLSDLGSGYDYLALGHIHMPQVVAPRAYYSGSPLPVSFSEEYAHSVNLVEISRRGAEPTVTPLPLGVLRHVKTIPAGGAPLQEALNALVALPDDDPSYIRLLIDSDGPLPPDADDRARRAAAGKACRYCEVKRKERADDPAAHGPADNFHIEEVDDFHRISPLDVAARSYERLRHVAMPDNLLALVQQAINLVEQDRRI